MFSHLAGSFAMIFATSAIAQTQVIETTESNKSSLSLLPYYFQLTVNDIGFTGFGGRFSTSVSLSERASATFGAFQSMTVAGGVNSILTGFHTGFSYHLLGRSRRTVKKTVVDGRIMSESSTGQISGLSLGLGITQQNLNTETSSVPLTGTYFEVLHVFDYFEFAHPIIGASYNSAKSNAATMKIISYYFGVNVTL